MHDQVARADRVVVAGDDVVGLVGIAVRVDECDHRHVQPARLAHGELLLLQVDDEDRVRLPAHVRDAAEVRLELLQLARHRDALLRREQLELALVPQAAHLVQALDPVGDRPPVGEQAAEPPVIDVRHADALRLVLDGVLRLLLRADEQDGAAPLRDVAEELPRFLETLRRLREVDDVDAAALGEDEAAHLRVPAPRLVAEVDSGLQQLAHRNRASRNCHEEAPSGFSFVSSAGGSRGAPPATRGTRATAGPPGSRNGTRGRVAGPGQLWRAASRAAARSGGSGDETSTRAPVAGCSKARRAAWRNCRSSPRSPETP